ncbi:LPS assembly protein LptD [Methylobacterium oryzae CBMB20]
MRFQANITSLTRETTQYQGLPRTSSYRVLAERQRRELPALPDLHGLPARHRAPIDGLAGTNTRASAELSWRRSFIDDWGQKFTPFAYLRTDAFFTNPSFSGYQNDLAPQVAKIDDGFAGRVMPAVGLDYRYPFVANFGALGVHTLEPIGQIIARPSETRIGHLPNEDAQSLVFDDTSLFEWDKFSGYDRVEGGVRTNLGGQYSVVTPSGWYANVLFGESIQLAGVNSFRRGDIANVGLDSGLETQRSDFVGRFQVSPNQNITVHQPRPVRPVRLPRGAVRDRRDGAVRAVPAADRLGLLLVLRGAAAARLQPLPRGHHRHRHLQHHAELVRLGLAAGRPDPLPRRPQHLSRTR